MTPIRPPSVRDGKSVDQGHDWPWLSTAMTIEPDPGALFGSTPLAAMPLRMMQMFVGMPLVGTRNDLTAVVGRLEAGAAMPEYFE
ncbi:hypothetical protein ABIB75_007513 [Bradyrhizobium sp. GM2.2]|uniref:hypothetical protein n=1 Tax=Bradyrhizobium sp. GM2.2 TaxID=3156358 RepID=UPI00339192A0